MSHSVKLEELRSANQCLLNRLKEKQDRLRKWSTEEAKTVLHGELLCKFMFLTELLQVLTPCGEIMELQVDEVTEQRECHFVIFLDRNMKRENKAQNCVRNDSMQRSLNRLQQDPTLFATPGQASAARRALSSSRKYNYVCEQNQANSVLYPKKEFSAKPTNNLKSHNEYKNLKHVKIKFPGEHQTFSNPVTQTSTELYKCDGLQYADQLMDEGNIRNKEPRTPKSCLLTPGNKDSKRDFGHVTFLSNNTDKTQRWSPRPFLGYDWIAGLLEAESPVANKSEQFYSDINEFRRVNREECVHNYYTDPEAQETSSSEDELDGVIDTHDCVYCYRVNNRLFTSPVGSESACPICKKRRSKRPPTIEEPAYIRVSIPRSTLLPPYKYKAHRRKSFDPTDSLALPSHCLVGWENAVPSCDLNIASLDLKTSVPLGTKAHVSTFENSTMDNTSYYDSRARSENLLNMSRCMFLQSCNKN